MVSVKSSISFVTPPSEPYTFANCPLPEAESSIEAPPERQSENSSQELPSESPPEVSLAKELQIFFSTFITIFLAELGDKTQVTTLLMSAESHAPWVVFAGAGAALVATSLLGVLVGHWLSKRVSQRTLEVAAAMMLLTVSLLLVWDVVQA